MYVTTCCGSSKVDQFRYVNFFFLFSTIRQFTIDDTSNASPPEGISNVRQSSHQTQASEKFIKTGTSTSLPIPENNAVESIDYDGNVCANQGDRLLFKNFSTALYEDTEESDMGSMENHGSVITHLLSQVKIGMDLTKVVLPTFILERRSLLEMYADYFAHPDLFLKYVAGQIIPRIFSNVIFF